MAGFSYWAENRFFVQKNESGMESGCCGLTTREFLQGDKTERINQALRKAGWFPNRRVDIPAVLAYYQQQGIKLNTAAITFYQEYYGIASRWYISAKLDAAPDFDFMLFPQPPEYKIDVKDFMYDDPNSSIESEEYSAVKACAEETVVMVGEIGYYYPARVWIGDSGMIYCTHEYDDKVLKFDSVMGLLQHELSHHSLDSVAMKP